MRRRAPWVPAVCQLGSAKLTIAIWMEKYSPPPRETWAPASATLSPATIEQGKQMNNGTRVSSVLVTTTGITDPRGDGRIKMLAPPVSHANPCMTPEYCTVECVLRTGRVPLTPSWKISTVHRTRWRAGHGDSCGDASFSLADLHGIGSANRVHCGRSTTATGNRLLGSRAAMLGHGTVT